MVLLAGQRAGLAGVRAGSGGVHGREAADVPANAGGGARSVQFTVPGQPIGKGRPIAGKSFGGHTTLRTPAKTVSYENLVGWTAAQAMAGLALMDGPVKAALTLQLQIPASWSQKKQRAALAGAIRPTTKPDVDNVVKAIFDAINGVVWKDDVQVVLLTVAKVYSHAPGVQVYVERLEAEAA